MKTYHTRSIMTALLLAGFVGMFSESALNIALTNLMKTFNVNTATIQWLVTGYLLTLGILMPFTGLLLKMMTTRRMFSLASLSLLIGTSLAAVSQTFAMLMIARVIQAAGMGLLLPLIYNTVLVIVPPAKRGSAIGYAGLILAFAPALGPAVSGIIIQYLSWHDIFWFLLIILIIGMALGFKNIDNVTEVSHQSIDSVSATLAVLGFGSLVFGLGQAGQASIGWTAPMTLILIGVGVVALTGFSLRQFQTTPLLDLHVFQYPMYTLGITMTMVCQIILTATLMLLPMFLQNSLGLPVLVAGLALLPGSLINGFLQLTAGNLYDHFGPSWVIIPGLVLVCAGLLVLMHVSSHTALIVIVIAEILLTSGIALIWPASQTNALNQLPRDLYAHGSAILNTLQQVIGAVSTAIAMGLMTSRMNDYLGTVQSPMHAAAIANGMALGVQRVFAVMLTLAIVGIIISLFVRKSTPPDI